MSAGRGACRAVAGSAGQYHQLNPAQLRRDTPTLGDRLLALVTAKHPPVRRPVTPPARQQAS